MAFAIEDEVKAAAVAGVHGVPLGAVLVTVPVELFDAPSRHGT